MPKSTTELRPAGRALADRLRAAARYGENPQGEAIDAELAGGPKHDFVDENNDGKCDICKMPEQFHKGKAAADAETLRAGHAYEAGADGKCAQCGMAKEMHANDGEGTKTAAQLDAPGGTTPCADCGDPVLDENGQMVVAAAAVATDEAGIVSIDTANPGRFRAVLAVENERTADNRIIAAGATKWRTPPLPLMLMTRTADGHDGSEIAGVIETITRDGDKIVGEGRFDTGAAGLEAARLVANKVLTGVSIDAGDVEGAIEVEAVDEEGNPSAVLARMTALTILGATCVPFPAIASTAIEWLEPLAADTPLTEDQAEADTEGALTAAGPISYQAALFADPEFAGPTPLRVEATEDPEVWRVSGHAALWGQCHIGFPGTCVTPPKSRTGYSHFRTGSLPLVEGGLQPVGTITLDTNHPTDRPYGAREAALHYDHTGTAAAFVNVGEDAHGIWIAGVLKPGLAEACATVLSASSLSGDWRRIAGNLELVALLSVNTPGYPVAYTEGDEQVALVAAGYGNVKPTRSHEALAWEVRHAAESALARVEKQETELADLRDQVAALSRIVAPIARERIEQRLAPPGE